MTFREEATETFLDIFGENRDAIRTFPGCLHLELWRDRKDTRIFFTYSFWESEAALEAYRRSELFAATWEQTKALFERKAEAWSLDGLEYLP